MWRAVIVTFLAQSVHAGSPRVVPPCAQPPRVTLEVAPSTPPATAAIESTEAAIEISGRVTQAPNCTALGATFEGREGSNAPGVSGPLPLGAGGAFTTIVHVPFPQDGEPIRLSVRAVVVNEAGTAESPPASIVLPEPQVP